MLDLLNDGERNYIFLFSEKKSPRQGLTRWGRVTHICVGKPTTIGSDNGLSPERRQAINWTNAGILLIGPLGTNFSEIFIEIHTFLLKKIRLKMSSAKCCSFRFGLNVLNERQCRIWLCFMPPCLRSVSLNPITIRIECKFRTSRILILIDYDLRWCGPKVCNDLIAKDGITAKLKFHEISNTRKTKQNKQN